MAQWTEYHDSLVQEREQLLAKLYYIDVTTETVKTSSSDPYAYLDTGVYYRDEVVEIETRDSDVWTRIQAIDTELAAATIQDKSQELEAILEEMQGARDSSVAANESRYSQLIGDAETTPNPETVMSYPTLVKYMISAYFTPITTSLTTFKSAQSTLDQAVVDEWDTIWNTLDERLGEIGDQARSDIADAFTAKTSEAMQNLSASGAYNTSMAAALTVGLAAAQSAELRRLDESLGTTQVQTLLQVLQSKQQSSQIANENTLKITSAAIDWEQQKAKQLSELYALAPGVVERRTDTSPSLADEANILMNLGRGQGSQQMISAFTPQNFIQSDSGSSFDWTSFFSQVKG
jgi:hypothetical protein